MVTCGTTQAEKNIAIANSLEGIHYYGSTDGKILFNKSPCNNHGNLAPIDQLGNYTCSCNTDWGGKSCEFTSSDKCSGNGTITGTNNDVGYTCNCILGFEGVDCKTVVVVPPNTTDPNSITLRRVNPSNIATIPSPATVQWLMDNSKDNCNGIYVIPYENSVIFNNMHCYGGGDYTYTANNNTTVTEYRNNYKGTFSDTTINVENAYTLGGFYFEGSSINGDSTIDFFVADSRGSNPATFVTISLPMCYKSGGDISIGSEGNVWFQQLDSQNKPAYQNTNALNNYCLFQNDRKNQAGIFHVGLGTPAVLLIGHNL